MTTKNITFTVDQNKLFNALKAKNGDTSVIGDRVIYSMVAGEAGIADAIAMAFYGIAILPEPPNADDPA